MTEQELKDAIKQLSQKYIDDPSAQKAIISDAERYGSEAAKGILADLTRNMDKDIDEADARIIKEIAFYFC